MATAKTNPGNEINVTVIGDSVRVQGNLSGDEDLHVLGRVDGRIELQRTLVVAPSGIVKAEVMVKNAIVSGVVVGNLHATESVEITKEGRMVGDIFAPRVIIVDGASFRGSVDMGDIENMPVRKAQADRPKSTFTPTPRPAPSASTSSTPAKAAPPPPPKAAPPPPPVLEAQDEEEEEESQEDTSTDPPAAKGLPQKSHKARVFVKRK
jgi:cytoskeletal protein CcmA (bactofilin family)